MSEQERSSFPTNEVQEIDFDGIRKVRISKIQYDCLKSDYSKQLYLYLNSFYATQNFIDEVALLQLSMDELGSTFDFPKDMTNDYIIRELVPSIAKELVPFFISLYVDFNLETDKLRFSFVRDHRLERRFPSKKDLRFILDSIVMISNNMWLNEEERLEVISNFLKNNSVVLNTDYPTVAIAK